MIHQRKAAGHDPIHPDTFNLIEHLSAQVELVRSPLVGSGPAAEVRTIVITAVWREGGSGIRLLSRCWHASTCPGTPCQRSVQRRTGVAAARRPRTRRLRSPLLPSLLRTPAGTTTCTGRGPSGTHAAPKRFAPASPLRVCL